MGKLPLDWPTGLAWLQSSEETHGQEEVNSFFIITALLKYKKYPTTLTRTKKLALQ